MQSAKQRLAARRQRVEDLITGVVRQAYLGALLFGPGGDGKSFEITRNLDLHNVFFGIANSRLSGLGLFQFLERHRNAVCLIEDAESILRDRNALGVLRSATEGSQTGRDGSKMRKVTYHSHGKLREFVFTGAVILTMNRGLSDLPEAEALATRLQVIDYSLDEDEMIELMIEICEGPDLKTQLTSEERHEVTAFVIECARRGSYRINLRMQALAFEAFGLWSQGDAGLHWQDTVDSQIQRHGIVAKPIVSFETRAQQINAERRIAREIFHLPAYERLTAWEDQTGKSRAAMYRRMDELRKTGASHFAPIFDESRSDMKVADDNQAKF